MEATQEILHEDCSVNRRYLIEMGGQTYQARFTGYRDNNQYSPTFEITGRADEFRILRELE